MPSNTYLLITFTFYITSITSISIYRDEASLQKFFKHIYEPKLAEICTMRTVTEYYHARNLNDETAKEMMIKQALNEGDFIKDSWSSYFRLLNPDDYEDMDVRRKVSRVVYAGNQALEHGDLERMNQIINAMMGIGQSAKICSYKKKNCNNDADGLGLSDIEDLMGNTTDYDELLYYWKEWHNNVGRKVKLYYPEYVKLSNDAACKNNFTDKGAAWRYIQDTPHFEQYVEQLWEDVKPLYYELQSFVYRQLKRHYQGRNFDDKDGCIPAHLLGNIHGQSWVNIAPIITPFPHAPSADITKELKDHNYSVLKMFDVADEFYQSIGLYSTKIAYDRSYIVQPENKSVLCQPTAWDYCNGADFRITMCGKVNFKDFIDIHHEMGHVQYYLLYRKLSYLFREGANPAFHEAIGDTIALSVSTPYHLQKIGLLENYVESKEAEMNTLMKKALEHVPFLPYAYVLDKWRWDIFRGRTTKDSWNNYYWNFRKTIQKVKPPIERSDKTDFDGGIKFHVTADTQYISYFISSILQFQIHRGLCMAAGQYKPGNENMPLHKCDIYRSRPAGAKLRAALMLGYSKPWPDVLQILTGERIISAKALMEYFQPLYKYLQRENKNLKHMGF